MCIHISIEFTLVYLMISKESKEITYRTITEVLEY